MIDLENKKERDKLIDDYFNKGKECDIKEVYQAIVNSTGDLEYEVDKLRSIIKEVREYINSIDEIEVRYLDKEALYRNSITEYQIQEQLKKDKTLEGHFVKVNKNYLLEILDKGEEK